MTTRPDGEPELVAARDHGAHGDDDRLSALRDLQAVWDDWAKADPLWAIYSDPAKKGRRWEHAAFFATGRAEIAKAMDALARHGLDVRRRRCLDFGCGVGRLTQALVEHFEHCDGVDISAEMVRQAQALNPYPDRCTFHVNDGPDLSLFEDKSFDLVYSDIVLQHIPPDLAEGYVREFVRLLDDGGVAIFQVPAAHDAPSEPEVLPDGAHRARITVLGQLSAMSPGASASLPVRVSNDSPHPWPRAALIRLANHWRKATGELAVLDDGRTALPGTLEPGADAETTLTVQAPVSPGNYELELDLVQETVCWFSQRGSATLRVPVRVRAPGAIRRLVRRARGGDASSMSQPEPRLFDMYTLPRDRVVAAVEDAGGVVVGVDPYDSVAEGWESYRYFVQARRPGADEPGAPTGRSSTS